MKKEIYFLIEGTSSLDPKSEDEILYYLSNKKDLTKVVISHRKNTLKYCNKVIDFTSGKACLKNMLKNRNSRSPVVIFLYNKNHLINRFLKIIRKCNNFKKYKFIFYSDFIQIHVTKKKLIMLEKK